MTTKQLPAVGTTVYVIAKNSGTFRLEVVEGKMSEITDHSFCVERRRTAFLSDLFCYQMHAWRQEAFPTLKEAEVGLALLLDQQSGDGSQCKLAAKVGRVMPTPPGKVLAKKLQEQHISVEKLQAELGISDSEYYTLVCGTRILTKPMAEKLGDLIEGTCVKYWMTLEMKYRMQRESLIRDLVKEANNDA